MPGALCRRKLNQFGACLSRAQSPNPFRACAITVSPAALPSPLPGHALWSPRPLHVLLAVGAFLERRARE